MDSGGKKRTASRVIPKILQDKPVGREKRSLQRFPINHVQQFLVPNFCCSFWKSMSKNPSSLGCPVVTLTGSLTLYLNRWKLHIVRLSKGLEILPCFETDISLESLELKIVNGRGYETNNIKKVQKEHKEEAKADEEMEEEQKPPVPLVTHVNNNVNSFLSNVEVTSTISRNTTLM